MKPQFTTFVLAVFTKQIYLVFALKVQVMANSAMVSPAAFLPVERIMAVVGLPDDMASLTNCVTSWPSSQVKVVRPVAFFIKFPSTLNTSILTAGSCL